MILARFLVLAITISIGFELRKKVLDQVQSDHGTVDGIGQQSDLLYKELALDSEYDSVTSLGQQGRDHSLGHVGI